MTIFNRRSFSDKNFQNMKRTFIYTGIIAGAAVIFLIAFTILTDRGDKSTVFAEVFQGSFEITINATGELMAEKSVDIMGPDIAQRRDVRSSNIRIQDLVPEGTVVNAGDYVATLDRTLYANDLKDLQERLATLNTELGMRLLDSTVVLNGLRDDIRNQKFTVEEARITLRNSQYESPAIVRQAEINLDQAQRTLDQKKRYYTLRVAQLERDINNRRTFIGRLERRVSDTQELLEGFTITAPSAGMVVYKRDRRGTKRRIGSTISPFDRAVASLPDLSTMVSRVYINEIEMSRVTPGQKVDIRVDALPDKLFKGTLTSIANIGEALPNSDFKMFEAHIVIDGIDPEFRPSMTTDNKIYIKTYDNVVYVPLDCVRTGPDSIPVVYTRSGHKQVVIPGESNDKFVIIEKGLEPGPMLHTTMPERPEKFKLAGAELIPLLRNRETDEDDLAGSIPMANGRIK